MNASVPPAPTTSAGWSASSKNAAISLAITKATALRTPIAAACETWSVSSILMFRPLYAAETNWSDAKPPICDSHCRKRPLIPCVHTIKGIIMNTQELAEKIDENKTRTEERRVGKERGRTCQSRWAAYHSKKKKKKK